MIKIRNLKKQYFSKKGSSCLALDGINLDLPDKGLVFVLGKSGSGKSTLLNIIGGLDKPTEGDITYNGRPFNTMNENDLDTFRGYLGFIFQDSYLIEYMTVYENVSLALEIHEKQTNQEKIIEILKTAEIEELKDRFLYELSGGQKQRVTLARALVKDPRIVLADEPTGNLDSKTGEMILSTLKKFSDDRLVIVVTHDRDFAEKFGDRVIEIKDGHIVHDTDSTFLDHETKKTEYLTRNYLPFKYVFRMSLSNIIKKPIRLSITLILSLLFFMFLSVSFALNTVDSEKTIIRNLKKNNINYVALGIINDPYKDPLGYDMLNYNPLTGANFPSDVVKEIKEKYNGNGYLAIYYQSGQNLITGDFNLLNYRLLEESLPLDDDSAYITDIKATKILKEIVTYYDDGNFVATSKYYILQDGAKVNLTRSYNINNLIGKTIYENRTDSEYLKVAGIMVTEEDKFVDYYYSLNYYNQKLYEYNIKNLHDSLYVTEEYVNTHYQFNPNGLAFDKFKNLDLKINENEIYEIIINKEVNFPIFFKDSVKKEDEDFDHDEDLNDGEVIISLKMYNDLFNKDYSETDLFDFVNNVKLRDLEHIGESLNLKINDKSGNEIINNNYLISGVIIDNEEICCLSISDNDYLKISEALPPYVYNMIMLSQDEYSTFKMLKDLKNNNIYLTSPFSEIIYTTIDGRIAKVNYLVMLLFLFIITVFLSSFISSCIRAKKQEIGLLRSQGATVKDVMKIYITESIIIALFLAILNVIICPISIYFYNKMNMEKIMPGLSLVYPYIWSYVLVFILPFVIALISTILPVRIIGKLNPIDALKKT